MTTYPRLTEMGIENPQQIADFSVSSFDYIDYIRITYERPKGSVRPFSKTYKFPRVQKAAKGNIPGKGKTTLESNSAYKEAVIELQHIIKARTRVPARARLILEEIQQLEEEIAIRCSRLKSLLSEKGADPAGK